MSGSLLIKPPALRPGDTIGIIAPASSLADAGYLARGTRFLRRRGYRVRLGKHLNKALEQESTGRATLSGGTTRPAAGYRPGPGTPVEITAGARPVARHPGLPEQGAPAGMAAGPVPAYLAGSDAGRLADLHQMFRDPEVRAIICLRGGYGSLRLLPGVDYHLIRSRPKILVGYSDITALHLACNKMAGLVTFHGPMIYPELGGEEVPAWTQESLFKALTLSSPPPAIIPPVPVLPPVTIVPGRAEGVVTGGNLSLVTATLGTPFEIDTGGKILFLEEVGEAPYRIDRMLTQLKLAGKLEVAAGIVFGLCIGCEDPATGTTLLEVIAAIMAPLPVPCFYGLPAGHLAPQATLPLGVRARLDATACTLTFLETAVAPV